MTLPDSSRVFLTGAAGFIGYHTAKRLLAAGHQVFGYDNINDYYDPRFKLARLDDLKKFSGFGFRQADLCDREMLASCWQEFRPNYVVHLAAQAGVRYSIENPFAYVHSNLVGFQNIIELARDNRPKNFVYASSSSVYGANKVLPFSETHEVSNPISLYAATKLSNELVAKCYGNLFQLPSTGLRFFTVYGPFSRPDMAMFKFAKLMQAGKPIPVFNHGKMVRDFTFVDDIVDGILASLETPRHGAVYNLGRGSPVDLLKMIDLLQEHLGIKAQIEMMPIQAGDVEATLADISKARRDLGYDPKTSIDKGVASFAHWYRENLTGLTSA
jgi:UDP-glucuronate 4-epimerase